MGRLQNMRSVSEWVRVKKPVWYQVKKVRQASETKDITPKENWPRYLYH